MMVMIMYNIWEHMILCSRIRAHCEQNVSDKNQVDVSPTFYILNNWHNNYIKQLPVFFSASISNSDFHSLNVFLVCDPK
jgi:hypothetical protein